MTSTSLSSPLRVLSLLRLRRETSSTLEETSYYLSSVSCLSPRLLLDRSLRSLWLVVPVEVAEDSAHLADVVASEAEVAPEVALAVIAVAVAVVEVVSAVAAAVVALAVAPEVDLEAVLVVVVVVAGVVAVVADSKRY